MQASAEQLALMKRGIAAVETCRIVVEELIELRERNAELELEVGQLSLFMDRERVKTMFTEDRRAAMEPPVLDEIKETTTLAQRVSLVEREEEITSLKAELATTKNALEGLRTNYTADIVARENKIEELERELRRLRDVDKGSALDISKARDVALCAQREVSELRQDLDTMRHLAKGLNEKNNSLNVQVDQLQHSLDRKERQEAEKEEGFQTAARHLLRKITALEEVISFYTKNSALLEMARMLLDADALDHIYRYSPSLATALNSMFPLKEGQNQFTFDNVKGNHPFRHYIMVRDHDEGNVSGTGVVADVIEFESKWVAVGWRSTTKSALPSVYIYPSMEYVHKLHGHNGKTRLVSYDPGKTIVGLLQANENLLTNLDSQAKVISVLKDEIAHMKDERDSTLMPAPDVPVPQPVELAPPEGVSPHNQSENRIP